MKQDDTARKDQTNPYPPKVIVNDDSFRHALALYRRRVHEQLYTLFISDFSAKNKKDNTNIQ